MAGRRGGPRSDDPGYDDLAQASTGVMARFGGSLDTPEEHAHFGTIDVLGGLCAVQAIGAALIRRARTGEGDRARVSLCAAGQLIQAPFMYDYAGRAPFDEPSGRAVTGWGPLYRAYAAEDGWLFLAARDDRLPDIDAIAGLEGAKGLSGEDLETHLAARFCRCQHLALDGPTAQGRYRRPPAGQDARGARCPPENGERRAA